MHGGFLHIISNLWFLWVFGDNVEAKLGFFLFPILYLTFGVAGALAQYIVGSDINIPMLGASGAIAGVLGAYLALFPHHRVDTLIPVFGFPAIIPISAAIMLFYWFFIQLISGAAALTIYENEGIAWFAHIGGFLGGWLVGKIFKD